MIRPKRWYRYLFDMALVVLFGGLALGNAAGWRPSGFVSAAILLALLALFGPLVWNRRELYRAYLGDRDSIKSVTAGRSSLFEEVRDLPRG